MGTRAPIASGFIQDRHSAWSPSSRSLSPTASVSRRRRDGSSGTLSGGCCSSNSMNRQCFQTENVLRMSQICNATWISQHSILLINPNPNFQAQQIRLRLWTLDLSDLGVSLLAYIMPVSLLIGHACSCLRLIRINEISEH